MSPKKKKPVRSAVEFQTLEPRAFLSASTPFSGSPINVSGIIEAENYDLGGEGVAYHDTTPTNLGNAYRTTEAVDVQHGGSNGFDVGFIRPGEYLKYTIYVPKAGTYELIAKVASDSPGGIFHVLIDDSNKTGPMTLLDTHGRFNWKNLQKSGIRLTAGTHVMTLHIDSSFNNGDIGNIDYLRLVRGVAAPSAAVFQPKKLVWHSEASNPLQREEAQSFVYNGKLYEVGGYLDGFQATTEIDVADPNTGKWTRVGDMPYAITHAAVAADPDGHTFWFIGGFLGSFKHNPERAPLGTAVVMKYDAAKNTWSMGPTLPSPRGAGGAGIVNGKLYFFGGSNKQRTKDMSQTYVLNLKNPAAGWKQVAHIPNPRNHLGGVSVNGLIYAIGGQHHLEDKSIMQNEVEQYNPATNTWMRVASLPVALSHFNAATVVYNRYIITVGGENPHNVAKPFVFAYDTMQNQWARLTDLPGPRRAGVAGVIGNILIQSTGYDRAVGETATTYAADLSATFT